MEGLLGGIASRLGGLLGDPKVKQALLASFATGGDPSQTGRLILAKNEQDAQAARDKQMEEYRKLQMEQAQLAAEQARQAQARQQYTQGVLGANYTPEQLRDPAFQAQLRREAAARGDISALEQGGLLNPLPKSVTMPKEALLYQYAQQDPKFAEWLQSRQASETGTGQYFSGVTVKMPDGTYAVVQPGNRPGMGLNTMPLPGVPVTSDPAIAAALAAGRAEGTAQGQATAAAPAAIASADDTLGVIDKAINHPGRLAATGGSSIVNQWALPGSDRKDFLTVVDQLQGTNFLTAYTSLKGGGQITEIEGKKAEQAQARLNTAQSEGEFLQALRDMRALVEERKRKAATLVSNPAGSGAIIPNSSPSQSAPQPGRVVDFNSL